MEDIVAVKLNNYTHHPAWQTMFEYYMFSPEAPEKFIFENFKVKFLEKSEVKLKLFRELHLVL